MAARRSTSRAGPACVVETATGVALLTLGRAATAGLVANSAPSAGRSRSSLRLRLVAPADADLRLPSSRLSVTAIAGTAPSA